MMTELPYGPGSPLVSLVTFFGGFIGGATLDSSRTQNSPAWPFLVASPTIAMFDEVVRRRSTSNWFTPGSEVPPSVFHIQVDSRGLQLWLLITC